MKNYIITTTLGLVLLTVTPVLAKESTKSQGQVVPQTRVAQPIRSEVAPSELTQAPRKKPVRKVYPKLLEVREVRYFPRGRGRYDEVPEPKPLYSDVF